MREAHAPVAEGVDAVNRHPVGRHYIGERAPVCHYRIARRARACAHRTGFSWSGKSISSRTAPRLRDGCATSGEQARPLAWDLQLMYRSGTFYARSGARSTVTSTRQAYIDGPVGSLYVSRPLGRMAMIRP